MKKDLKLNLMFLMVPLVLMFVVVIGVTYALFTKEIDAEEVITIKTGDKYVGVYGKDKDNIILNKEYNFTVENRGILETGYELYIESSTNIPLNKINYVIDGDEKISGTLDSDKILVGNLDSSEEISITLKLDSSVAGSFVGEIKARTSDYKVNSPLLVNGMIPVVFDGVNWIKADSANLNNNWYDYGDGKWANVVTLKEEKREDYQEVKNGDIIKNDDINTFFVWIPRYSYSLNGDYGIQNDGASTISKKTPGAFDIKFINTNVVDDGEATYNGVDIDEYYTPLAFCLGDNCSTNRSDSSNVELPGIWVSKFELTGTEENLSSIPNVSSLRNLNVSSFFNLISTKTNGEEGQRNYGFSGNYNSHMIRNTEWSILTYLTQSKYGKYGNDKYDGELKEVYQNKSDRYLTGCSYGSPSNANSDYDCQYQYGVTSEGVGASTTGTIYGVYDLSGGANEYVMANLNGLSGVSATDNSGFAGTNIDNTSVEGLVFPTRGYYDLYTSLDATNACSNALCKGQNLVYTKGWYDDKLEFVSNDGIWLVRGGSYKDKEDAGLFYVSNRTGKASEDISTRIAISVW